MIQIVKKIKKLNTFDKSMILGIIFTIVFMVSCGDSFKERAPKVIEENWKGCEYILLHPTINDVWIHKGNCRNHKY